MSPLALLLLNLIPGALQAIPGISSKIKDAIQASIGTVNNVISSGVLEEQTPETVLAAWAGELAVLKAEPDLPQGAIGYITELEKAVNAAVQRDHAAAQLVDWTTINPIGNV